MMKYIFYLVSILVILESCISHKNTEWEKYVESTINSNKDKKIILPDSIAFILNPLNKDIAKYNEKKRIKIVSYVDATCGACLGNFIFWKNFRKELIKENLSCKMQFYIYTDSVENLNNFLSKVGFQENWYFDVKNQFITKNEIWDKRFQTLLVEENSNKVILMGDPSTNAKLKDLYLQVISDMK